MSESKKVDRVIMMGKKAVEQEDLSTIMALVGEDYYDKFGMNYERLENWFRNQFQKYDAIKIFFSFKRIGINGNNALCSLRVNIRALNCYTGEPEVIYGYQTYGDELILDLIKTDNKWLFVGARF